MEVARERPRPHSEVSDIFITVCKRRFSAPAAVLGASVLTGACAVSTPAPDAQRAPLTVPDAWSAGAGTAEPVQGWVYDIADPTLRALIDEALNRNFELRAAAARMAAARAQVDVTDADRLPQLEARLSGSRTKRSDVNDTSFRNNPSDRFNLQGQLSWEADIWGRLAHATRAALAEWEASAADYQAARLSLAATVGREWFNLLEANQQLRLAEQTVNSFTASLAVIEQLYRNGIGSALDVRLARQNLATANSNLAFRQRRSRAARRVVETLLGRYPAAELDTAQTLPPLQSGVPAGLPSELLNRRPDLVAAERRLLAAAERTQQARKNRLPRFQLTADGGTSSDELKDLLDPDFLIWSLVGNLVQPVFQGGRLRAQEELSAARTDEVFNNYAQTLLTALREVETALDAEAYLADQEQALQTATREAKEAEILAREQYGAGLADIVTLLETQRRAFNSESSLLEVNNQRLQNRIDLYLSLGGDFADRPPAAGAAATEQSL